MYGPLIVAAAILLSIAGLVLFLHDLAEARSRKAFATSSESDPRSNELVPPSSRVS